MRRTAFAAILAFLAWPHPAAPQAATRTTLDSIGDVGEYSSVAIGVDGLGLISYYDATNTALKIAHCSNVECTAATLSTIDDAGNVGEYTSITIGGDGLGLISYYDRSNGNLKTAHCTNAPCTAANIRTVDAAPGDVGRYSSIATGSDGLGLIGYAIGDGFGLNVAHCHDADCNTATITTHPGPSGFSIEWMIGNDGLGLLVHMLSSGQYGPLRALHCANLDCSAATYNQLATQAGPYTAGPPFTLTRGAGGLGFVSYTITPFSLPPEDWVGHCVDVACTSVAFVGTFSHGFAAMRGADGFPMMAQNDLYVLDCVAADCTGRYKYRIDLAGSVQPSMALGADQKPLISYARAAPGDLVVAHCLTPDCHETGANLEALAFMDLFFPIGLGSRRDLRGTVLNAGPDPSAPGTELRLSVPAGLAVQGLTPGLPTCRLEGSEVICSATGIPVNDRFDVLIDTVVLVPGPATLSGTVSVSPGAFDLDPSNNSMRFDLPVGHVCTIDSDVAIQEGNGGARFAEFTIRRSGSLAVGDSVYYFVDPGTATAGVDFQASSGVRTFAPGQETITLQVPILGETLVETDETFTVGLYPINDPGACAVTDVGAVGTIVDDDAPVLSRLEVGHGTNGWHAVGGGAPPWTDVFRLRQEPYASYEVLVDGASGDMLPFTIERLAADNATVLSSSAPGGTAASVHWENDGVATTDNQHLRVRSTGCTSGCGADDVYRLRAYETTASIPRVNNTNGQVSLVILQNTTSSPVSGHVRFWSPAGALVATSNLSLGPRATMVLNTTQIPGVAGNTSSATVGHDGPYAALAGKAVALGPATGFSFDSPLVNRPR